MSLIGTGDPSSTYKYPRIVPKQGRLTWLFASLVSIANSFPSFLLDQPVLEGRFQQAPIADDIPQEAFDDEAVNSKRQR